MVPVVGLEPTRCRQQRILSPPRLPIPTHRQGFYQLWGPFGKILEIGGHGGGQKSNFSIFDCQKIPKSGDFRSSERQTEKDFLSPSRLPIPSHRRCEVLYHRNGGLARDFLRRLGKWAEPSAARRRRICIRQARAPPRPRRLGGVGLRGGRGCLRGRRGAMRPKREKGRCLRHRPFRCQLTAGDRRGPRPCRPRWSRTS